MDLKELRLNFDPVSHYLVFRMPSSPQAQEVHSMIVKKITQCGHTVQEKRVVTGRSSGDKFLVMNMGVATKDRLIEDAMEISRQTRYLFYYYGGKAEDVCSGSISKPFVQGEHS